MTTRVAVATGSSYLSLVIRRTLGALPRVEVLAEGVEDEAEFAWFAARPSGTEDVYKIYAESFLGAEHLAKVQAEAKAVVDAAIA